MARHFLTLDSIGRDGILVNLELARHLKSIKGMTREAIPVVPAAHNQCGGVATALNGRSSLRGLYAAGECAVPRVVRKIPPAF